MRSLMRWPAGRLLATLLLCSSALAGCSGGDGGPMEVEVAPGQVITVTEAPKPTHGIVSGIVGDDALYPLPGATVWVLGLNLSTTTDSNGRFALVNVPAGVYILEGSKKDHATVQTTADVLPGETARAVLLLQRIPSTDPYHTTYHQEAFMEFSGAGVSFSGTNTSLPFELDESRAVTLVLESRWDGTVASTATEPFDFEVQEISRRTIVAGRMTNPYSVHIDARVLPPAHDRFLFSVWARAPEPTVMVEARGDLFATIFYNEAAPSGWSILAGDS
jgi:hypothetical protein